MHKSGILDDAGSKGSARALSVTQRHRQQRHEAHALCSPRHARFRRQVAENAMVDRASLSGLQHGSCGEADIAVKDDGYLFDACGKDRACDRRAFAPAQTT